MADIRITKIDEEKSRPSDSNPFYVLVLSDKPDQDWKTRLDILARKPNNTRIVNVRIEGNPGNQLTLNTGPDVPVQQMLDSMQTMIKQVNEQGDKFKEQIGELNKKLAAQA